MIRITEEDYKTLLQPTGNGKKPSPRAPRKRNPNHVSESLVVSACIKWLWSHGCYIWRNNTGMLFDKKNRPVRYGYVGSPDIIGMTPTGRFLGIECKSPTGGDLSEPQERFRDRCRANGGIYLTIRSVDQLEERKGEILK